MEYERRTSARDGLLPNEVPSPREARIIGAVSPRTISRPMSRDAQGTDIIYNNINYCLPVKLNGKKQEKQILKNAR